MRDPVGANQVEISVSDHRRPDWLADYRAFCLRLLRALDLRGLVVSILLTSDTTIRDLNRRYRGLDRATDVLSFSQTEGGPSTGPARRPGGETHARAPEWQGGKALLGDIVISLPAALRGSRRFGGTLEGEVRRLTAHGLLHLLGWDHRSGAERRRMTERQEGLLAATQEVHA